MKSFCISRIFSLLLLPLALTANAQERKQNYFPEGESFVCINGENRFTRPLYGTNTTWRLETSDRPIFATYSKPKSYNISLSVNGVPLDKTAYCKAYYTAGKRTYSLYDERICADSLYLTAIPLADREGALFKIANVPLQETSSLEITATLSGIKAKKLSRAGDLGADAPDAFEAGEKLLEISTSSERFLFYEAGELRFLTDQEGDSLFSLAETKRQEIASSMRIVTPDPYINTLGGAIAMAADGCWDETSQVWQHGANGWRMPLNGWRCGYIGDCLGWFDRARTHFNNYAASQVTNIEPIFPHPAQDSTLNLARAEKKWGTQMYSNGYICRNPQKNNQMHHYDMNLVYIDALLWHILWTGDIDYARSMFPVIQRHLEWEKRNFDPDDDGLYDAYCCIWASDALYYNSGAVTHSSAYNYRANKIAADIAEKLGIDPTPYHNEAAKIKTAINGTLWMKDEGVWAEFKDFMGKKRLHKSPAVWTIYHAIDSDVSDISQYYKATQWIDANIPHIPVISEQPEKTEYAGFAKVSEPLQTISTTNWVPYSWSINNVAFAEVYHTALAYWQAGRPEEAFQLFKANIMDGMYLGKCPGNFGQISHYDKARGECYRDFSDCVGIASRAIVQGLFGIYPDMLNDRIVIRPGFPDDWNHAELHTAYIDYVYEKKNGKAKVSVETHFGRDVKVQIEAVEGSITLPNRNNFTEQPTPVVTDLPSTTQKRKAVKLDKYFNAQVRDIFRNRYLSPRSPYTTLQIPAQGIGDWCSPKETAEIESAEPIVFTSLWDNYPDSVVIPLPKKKATGIILEMAGSTNHMQCHMENGRVKVEYTDGSSQTLPLVNPETWAPIEQDFYFDSIAFRRNERFPKLMRRSFKTGEIFNCIESTSLYSPHGEGNKNNQQGWHGKQTDEMGRDTKELYRFNHRHIDGGASVLLHLPLDSCKTLKSLTVESLSNDVVIGLLKAELLL